MCSKTFRTEVIPPSETSNKKHAHQNRKTLEYHFLEKHAKSQRPKQLKHFELSVIKVNFKNSCN